MRNSKAWIGELERGKHEKVQKQEERVREREACQYVTMDRAVEQGSRDSQCPQNIE